MALRSVVATRYVAPLREGGSLPGLVEADDLGTYVVKFRGAGQGVRALVAEVVTGELGRRLGLPVPELVLVEVDARMGNAEPDQEVQDLLRASDGTNLGMDYLPGALGLEAATATAADPDLAAQVVWFDAFTLDVDRSWRNPNLLLWHGQVWLIDHGASLYFHHSWPADAAAKAYPNPGDHVLLRAASSIPAAHERLAPQITEDLLRDVLALVPDGWLEPTTAWPDPAAVRAAYVSTLRERVMNPGWLAALEVARASAL